MRIIGCQYGITWESPEANFRAVDQLLESSAIDSESLIVLPEMFATGFSMNVDRIADNPLIKPYLADLALKHRSWIIAGNVTRAPDGRGSNQALIFSPAGTQVGSYNKIHPFSFGGEDKVYAPGETVHVFDVGNFRICPFVCYDLRFPEIFRTATQMGANTFVVIANWPSPRTAHWTALLRARAIENQAFVVGVNRTGKDPKLNYSGHSVVFTPLGETISEQDESTSTVDAILDLPALEEWRGKFPALQDIHQSFIP
jgi:omega-amidase